MIFKIIRPGHPTVHIYCGDFEPVTALKHKIRLRHPNLAFTKLKDIRLFHDGKFVDDEQFCYQLYRCLYVYGPIQPIPTMMKSGTSNIIKPVNKKIQISCDIEDIDVIEDILDDFVNNDLSNVNVNIGQRYITKPKLRCIIYQLYMSTNRNQKVTRRMMKWHYSQKLSLFEKNL